MKKIANYDWSHLNNEMEEYNKGFRGGTRKIADVPPRPCQYPEHNPPSLYVFDPGVYEHTCPQCGEKKVFRVDFIY